MVFSSVDTELMDQYCPRVTNVAVVSHADDSNKKFWDVWKEGAEGALGGSIGLTFMDVGFDARKGTEAIENVCNSRDYDALLVTVPFEKDTYEYILMDEAIDACAVKGKPIFTTNTDTYHNENAYAYVGAGNYDMGRSCAQAVLHPDDLDVMMGRKKAPLTSSIDRSATYSFYREDEDKNDSLNRRVQGLVDEFKKQEIDVEEFTGFDTNLDRDTVVFVMSMNHISKFDWPNAFLCGDEDVSRPDIRQYGQSPFMQGLTAVLTAAAAADIKYKGREWNAAKGNPSDGAGTMVSTQAVRSTTMTSVCKSSENMPCVPIESLPVFSTLGVGVDLGMGGTSTKPNVLQNVDKMKTVSTVLSEARVQYYQYKSTEDFSKFVSAEADVEVNYYLASVSASVSSTTSESGSNKKQTIIARGYQWDNVTGFDRSEFQKADLNPDFITDLGKTCDEYKTNLNNTHFKRFLEAWGTHFIGAQYYGGYATAKMSLDYVTTSLKNSFLTGAGIGYKKVFIEAEMSAKFKIEAEKRETEIKIEQDYYSKFSKANPDPDPTETRNDPSKMKKWIDDLIYTQNNAVVLVSHLYPWTVLPQVKTVLKRCGEVFNPDDIYPEHVFTGRSLMGDLGKAKALVDYALTFVDSKLAILPSNQDLKELKNNFQQRKEEIDQVNYWDGYFTAFDTTKREINALLNNVEESVAIYPKVDTVEASTLERNDGHKRKRWGTGVHGKKPVLDIWSETDTNRGNAEDPYGTFYYRGNLIFELTTINRNIRDFWKGKVFLHLYKVGFNKYPRENQKYQKATEFRIWRCGETGSSQVNETTAAYPILCNWDKPSGTIYTRVNTDHQNEWLVVDITKFFDAALPVGDLHLQIDFPINEYSKYMHIASKEYTREGEKEKLWPKLVLQ
eukprot:CAMPEP_0194284412 /NCGR_PEP_ID=MMETSP0169-20130528/27576_1 /TAXON_ID=218684 /ORGANISM="Corethron pennatum, Strain L29A3" /LENGTH=896 /DNA_ID=CAMNT_0039030229 /DNA_START=275 /DNA_END=2965 /DNA_ORIENTATION=-